MMDQMSDAFRKLGWDVTRSSDGHSIEISEAKAARFHRWAIEQEAIERAGISGHSARNVVIIVDELNSEATAFGWGELVEAEYLDRDNFRFIREYEHVRVEKLNAAGQYVEHGRIENESGGLMYFGPDAGRAIVRSTPVDTSLLLEREQDRQDKRRSVRPFQRASRRHKKARNTGRRF